MNAMARWKYETYRKKRTFPTSPMISMSCANTSPLCRSVLKSCTGFKSGLLRSCELTHAMYACSCWVHSNHDEEVVLVEEDDNCFGIGLLWRFC